VGKTFSFGYLDFSSDRIEGKTFLAFDFTLQSGIYRWIPNLEGTVANGQGRGLVFFR
jgi:hypothetical protein